MELVGCDVESHKLSLGECGTRWWLRLFLFIPDVERTAVSVKTLETLGSGVRSDS